LVGDLYLCESEGIVYSEAITKRELNQLGVFVSGTLADVEVKQFPPENKTSRLQILSRVHAKGLLACCA
jgi:hypothetical protein